MWTASIEAIVYRADHPLAPADAFGLTSRQSSPRRLWAQSMRYDQRNNADPNNQLLAKNFPGDITIDQIRGYFRQFGRLEDVQITFAHDGPGVCRCSCVSGSRDLQADGCVSGCRRDGAHHVHHQRGGAAGGLCM